MPSPMERSGRRQAFAAAYINNVGIRGRTASAPMEPVGWPSKMGSQVRPESVVFHTPPLFTPM